MPPELQVLLILLLAAVLFFTEVIPLAVTAILVPVSLSLLGILEAGEAFANWGNQWVIIFMAMFMVGEAMFRTGLAQKIGKAVVEAAGNKERTIIFLVMVVVGVLSAFLSNTGTVVVFVPIAMGIAYRASISPKKILLPLAFAASMGGMMTLIGTPPNGIVNDALDSAQLTPFGFFEFAWIGLLVFVIGITYMGLVGTRFLPEGEVQGEKRNPARGEEKGGEIPQEELRQDKMVYAVIIFVFIISSMALEWIPLPTAAMLGAALVIITGCITMEEAFKSVSWTTIFLFAGMLSMSDAMEVTGAAVLVAETVTQNIDSPLAVLAVLFFITVLTTNFMSNTATAALFAPIGMAIASALGCSPYPFLMGIATATSCCFLTPVATPPNTIVLGPGGFSFIDYVKAGAVLQVLVFILALIFIPLFWPF
ncbi:MAG: SLC13/DASS family transporter [Candidatus Syntrophonatronum acetioxidans]|uniref:SLC13/DASS family transporter n=1 Tax=Candidatus Syntrophonatronum acetioxidans TaxID=1795816 RepID=A0A424YEV9_9FIRM|nr:MAG: SLC13/DASS family transporter [Candidatus Syntrophonatronum acetioxidans]